MDPNKLLKKWEQYAKQHNLELNRDIDINLKAEVCAKSNGACPCLVHWRSDCPCKEALEEIKEANACYCMLFKKKKAVIDFKKHSEMTLRARDRLGIGKNKH